MSGISGSMSKIESLSTYKLDELVILKNVQSSKSLWQPQPTPFSNNGLKKLNSKYVGTNL